MQQQSPYNQALYEQLLAAREAEIAALKETIALYRRLHPHRD
ncbi:MAG: hypothetical protein ACK5QE_06835 [Sphingobacteriia bacterium]